MEQKTITLPPHHAFKPNKVVVTKMWKVCHAKSGYVAGNVNNSYDTERICRTACDNTKKNNPADIYAEYFPEGLKPRAFWIYPNGATHEAVEPAPTYVVIQERVDTSGEVMPRWGFLNGSSEPQWIGEFELDIERAKQHALELFPDAVFEILPDRIPYFTDHQLSKMKKG